MRAIGRGLGDARARDQTALRAGMTRACRHIVGIEQIGEALVEGTVRRHERTQQKLLEEPGDMRAVPFRRTGVGHRLHHLILGGKRRGAPLGLIANRDEGVAPEAARIAERLGNRTFPFGWVMQANGRT